MPLYWTDCFVFPHSVRSDLSSSPLGSPSSSSCPQFRSRKWNPPLQWTFPWLGLVGYKASWPNAYLTCLGFWYTWDLNCLNKTSHRNNQHFEHCSLGRANQFLQHMMGFHHNHWSHRHVHLKNSTIDRSVFSCGYIYNICYLWEHWHAHKLHLSLSLWYTAAVQGPYHRHVRVGPYDVISTPRLTRHHRFTTSQPAPLVCRPGPSGTDRLKPKNGLGCPKMKGIVT